MLVLSRKVGERVLLGVDVEVVVLGIRGSRVQLGFQAPPETTIRREELRGRETTAVAGSPNDNRRQPAA